MGNNASAGLDAAVHRTESRVGKVTITGRYHRLPKKLEDEYTPEKKVLGSGYNGQVFLARSKATGAKFAVKAFKLHGVSREKKEELETEAEIFLGMDHPHVARLTDVYESKEQLSLVMECMEGGELFQRVLKLKRFSEKTAVQAVWQMLLALNYIHEHSIVHRDLKLENFLYEKDDSDHLKLIDFGFSKIWDKNTLMDLSCGTLAYVAPEVLEKKYTEKCDLWSLGVITFILLVGYMPFHGTEKEQIRNIKEGNYTIKKEPWSRVSKEASDFVKKLLEKDPSKRMSAKDAMEHKWIKEQDSKERDSHVVDQATVDAMCNFAQASQFKRSCFQVMAWSLSNEERAKVRDAFIELDTSRTGVIKLHELKQALTKEFHLTDETILPIFEALDTSHDEEIHYSDFLAAMCCSRIKYNDALLMQTFRRFDTDNSGFISLENLKEVLGDTVDGATVDQMLKEADTSGDGQIDYPEFIKYLKNTASEQHTDIANKVIDRENEKNPEAHGTHQADQPPLEKGFKAKEPAKKGQPTDAAKGGGCAGCAVM